MRSACLVACRANTISTVTVVLFNCQLPQGVLRINQRNYEEAFVDDPVSADDER